MPSCVTTIEERLGPGRPSIVRERAELDSAPTHWRLDDSCNPDPVVGLDGALQARFVNQSAADLAGVETTAALGRGIDELVAIGLLTTEGAAIAKRVRTTRVAARHLSSRFGPDSTRWYDMWVVPHGTDGVACFARDITEMKQEEHQLRESIGRDSLTGLLNHAAFHEEISAALTSHGSSAPDGGSPFDGGSANDVALVLFDLDYLKLINDVHGHQSGDRALRAMADAMRATTRDIDRIARLGGDEFAALFVNVARDDVLRIAERTVKAVTATSIPGVGSLSASAGLAFVASTREPGDLFDRADAAVYDAKARGRGIVSVATTTDIAYASRRRDVEESEPIRESPELIDARDVETAARGALREWVQVLACSGGCLDLLDPGGRRVKAIAYYRFGHDDWKLAEQSYELSDYPNTAAALAAGRTYSCRIDDPDTDPAEAALLRDPRLLVAAVDAVVVPRPCDRHHRALRHPTQGLHHSRSAHRAGTRPPPRTAARPPRRGRDHRAGLTHRPLPGDWSSGNVSAWTDSASKVADVGNGHTGRRDRDDRRRRMPDPGVECTGSDVTRTHLSTQHHDGHFASVSESLQAVAGTEVMEPQRPRDAAPAEHQVDVHDRSVQQAADRVVVTAEGEGIVSVAQDDGTIVTDRQVHAGAGGDRDPAVDAGQGRERTVVADVGEAEAPPPRCPVAVVGLLCDHGRGTEPVDPGHHGVISGTQEAGQMRPSSLTASRSSASSAAEASILPRL